VKALGLPLVLILAWFCGGCVAYQIRDELKTTNQQLVQMSQQLDKMSADLKEVRASVDQTNPKLERSNHSLSVMEQSMEPIRISLRRIDDELLGFREEMDKIDKYIPLNIKPDVAPPMKQSPSRETTPQK
jgi:septal ring factor EnvC (AmiA/AmiB activator)